MTGYYSDSALMHDWCIALAPPDKYQTPRDICDTLTFMAAQVPGTAAGALTALGEWDQEHPTDLDDADVWYQTDLKGFGTHRLHFEGLATFAEIYLDDSLILRSRSMFSPQSVTIALAGQHRLTLCFRALNAQKIPKGRARWRPRMIQPGSLRFFRTSALGHMPGFAPPAAPVGPWRSVSMVMLDQPRLVSHVARTRIEGDDGWIEIELIYDSPPPSQPLATCDDQSVLLTGEGLRFTGALCLKNIRKWFPHTHGAQPLYDIQIDQDGNDPLIIRTGFRTVRVDLDTDNSGFRLIINDVAVFCRGAVWMPLDPLTLQNDPERLAHHIALARACGVNMFRVSGVTVYETDAFYRACDAAGILIWQDFMFANFDYPADDTDFTTDVTDEIRQFLVRTAPSPSIVVFCGGNEVYQQAAMMGVSETHWRSLFFEKLLPDLVAAGRPDVPYIANSPCEGGLFHTADEGLKETGSAIRNPCGALKKPGGVIKNPGGALPFHSDSGVSHYYGIGAYRRPLEDARRARVRFASECLGFANVPEDKTLHEDFGEAPLSHPLWPARIPRDQGSDQDFEQVRDHYIALLYDADPPVLRVSDPACYLDLSRAAVAETIEATIGEWRRPGSSCAGALIWFWKDLWASSGWGVVDWRGRPKSPWWAMRRAFRPVQVLLSDEGTNGLVVHCLNESSAPFTGSLSLQCLYAGKTRVMHTTRAIKIGACDTLSLRDCALWGAFFDTAYAYRFGPPAHTITIATLSDAAGAIIAEAFHFPVGRPAALGAPVLSVTAFTDDAGAGLRLQSDVFAQSVNIADHTATPDDNWFHLAPGVSRIIRFLEKDAVPYGSVAALGGTPVLYSLK